MKKLLLTLALIFSCSGSTSAADATAPYYVPPAQFSVALEVMDMGFANVFALFRTATGSFAFDETSKSISNLRLAIDTTSLLANTNENQRDLSNLLSAFQFPEIRIMAPDSVTFVDNKAEIKTTLTLHGTNKPVTFTATLNRSGKSPHGGGMWGSEGDAVGISMQGSFKRADFGITDSPEAPARFSDTINLRLEIQAIKQ